MRCALFKRGGWPLLLFFLSACAPKSNWSYCELSPSYPSEKITYLSYLPLENFSGIRLDLYLGHEEPTCLLGVLSRKIPSSKENPLLSYVTLRIGEEPSRYFLAKRLEGDEQILLPLEATHLIIDALSSEKSLSIKIQGGFHTECLAENFYGFKKGSAIGYKRPLGSLLKAQRETQSCISCH